jgi:probable F420-dependent oxidoreductase
VLYGYLSAITSLELATCVIILPQRQTALVAKQASEVDILCGGRFRLGIGIGWNGVEYEALGKTFSDRGERITEQVDLLRRLWTEQTITHEGPSERVIGAGLNPLPIQRPIPLWFGGQSLPAYRRAGQLGDGWFPMISPGHGLDEAKAIVEDAALKFGRDPAQLGMEGRVSWGEGGVRQLVDEVSKWRRAGASHVAINTMDAGFASIDDHLAALASGAKALGIN